MTGETIFVLALIVVAALMMGSNRVRFDIVALLVVLALILSGVLSVKETLAGFGSLYHTPFYHFQALHRKTRNCLAKIHGGFSRYITPKLQRHLSKARDTHRSDLSPGQSGLRAVYVRISGVSVSV